MVVPPDTMHRIRLDVLLWRLEAFAEPRTERPNDRIIALVKGFVAYGPWDRGASSILARHLGITPTSIHVMLYKIRRGKSPSLWNEVAAENPGVIIRMNVPYGAVYLKEPFDEVAQI